MTTPSVALTMLGGGFAVVVTVFILTRLFLHAARSCAWVVAGIAAAYVGACVTGIGAMLLIADAVASTDAPAEVVRATMLFGSLATGAGVFGVATLYSRELNAAGRRRPRSFAEATVDSDWDDCSTENNP